MKQNLKLNSSR